MADTRPQRVLILHTEPRELPGAALFDASVRAALASGAGQALEIYSESGDASRFPGDGQLRLHSEFLRRRYADKALDVIVSVSERGLDFLGHGDDRLFPGTPVVVGSLLDPTVLPRRPGVAGVLVPVRTRATFELVLGLHPGTRRILLVAGASQTDRRRLQEAERELRNVAPTVEVVDVGALPLAGVVGAAASQPSRTVIVYLHILQDGAGQLFSPRDALERIAAAANAPIYGRYETLIGHGIVGGHVFSFQSQGAKAAEVALRILRGERAADVGLVRHDSSVHMFDWRQLQRWGIAESRLPPGSVVRFRQPSAWEAYRGYAVAGGVVLALQSALIVGLLVSRRHRRHAQRALDARLRFETLLSELSAAFVALPAAEVDAAIERWLGRIVTELELDRAMLAGLEASRGLARVTHSWTREGIVPLTPSVDLKDFPWMGSELGHGHVVRFTRPDELPAAAAKDRHSLEGLGVRSLVAVPLMVGGSAVGSLAVSTLRAERPWPDALVQRLRLLAEIFANALARQGAARAIRESEERFRLMAEGSPWMVWMATPDGARTYFNRAWLDVTGRRLADEVGGGWADGVHPADREAFLGAVQKALAGGEPFMLDYRLRRRDGEYRWILDQGLPRTGDDGRVVGYIGSAHDVTELKRAQQALLETTALRSAIFGSLYGHVAALDCDGVIIAVNESWTRFASDNGADPSRVSIGANYLEVCRQAVAMGDADARRAVGAIASVLAGSNDRARIEYACRMPAGERWFELAVEPLRRLEGGAIVAHVDVTRRRQAEGEAHRQREELAHALRVTTMGELAASLAHEIKQPLTAILLNAQATVRLLDAAADRTGDGVRESLADIAADAQRASEIIRRLRAMFRKEHMAARALNVNELTEDVVGLLQYDLRRKGITVVRSYAPGVPPVPGDPIQIQQVMLNLLVNAGEAIAAAGDGPREIAIATARGPGVVEIAIGDTGVGVKEAELERIFERFVSTKPDGLGMGLAISRSIVEAHGGRIWATSKAERGLTVHVELPSPADDAR